MFTGFHEKNISPTGGSEPLAETGASGSVPEAVRGAQAHAGRGVVHLARPVGPCLGVPYILVGKLLYGAVAPKERQLNMGFEEGSNDISSGNSRCPIYLQWQK